MPGGLTVCVGGKRGFYAIDCHKEEIKGLIEQFGVSAIEVVHWGEYAEGGKKYRSRDRRTIVDMLCGD
jgi:hypothetical protein